ncbi:hypothetical protein [Acinetobacter venetianus]|uniref:hypothetical protein n=1 Tax=Acinetobacter venetianus TaxID=52133 RepID=UPI0028A273DE|nr:hypothetical protein [Acinetobacter venetianus]
MNTKLLLSSLICGLCFTTVAAHANTKSNTDQLAQKYVQVCKSKKQGDMVSFAQKGVIFNGVCQPNDAGKLVFQPPMPANNAMPETQSKISETQSAPRPVSAPMQAPMQHQMMQQPPTMMAPSGDMDQTAP